MPRRRIAAGIFAMIFWLISAAKNYAGEIGDLCLALRQRFEPIDMKNVGPRITNR